MSYSLGTTSTSLTQYKQVPPHTRLSPVLLGTLHCEAVIYIESPYDIRGGLKTLPTRASSVQQPRISGYAFLSNVGLSLDSQNFPLLKRASIQAVF